MKNGQINLGLIGIGYWGLNYIRICDELPGVHLKYVCDVDQSRFSFVRKTSPDVQLVDDYRTLLTDNGLDAVIVATPASTHYAIIKECLVNGKHVMAEKPLTLDTAEAEELAGLADTKHLVLMTGHVFEYNPAIIKMKELLQKGELGQLYYLHFTRTGLGPIRNDVNALWDLAPHDVSILLYLLEEEPLQVTARGRSFIQSGIEDVVFVTLEFASGIITNVHVSWLDPRKKREITAVGSEKMMVFDDMNATEKLLLYDKGVVKQLTEGTLDEFELALKMGEVHAPPIAEGEPLKEECAHFIDCLRRGQTPRSDGWSGYRVVKVLERAQNSLEKGRQD